MDVITVVKNESLNLLKDPDIKHYKYEAVFFAHCSFPTASFIHFKKEYV